MAFNRSLIVFVILFGSTQVQGSHAPVPASLLSISADPSMEVSERDSYRQISFQLARNLMVVTAYVNGKGGNFIIDTGAEVLTLNKKYFSGKNNHQAYGVDLAGSRIALAESKVQFGWEEDKSDVKHAIITDLSAVEQIMGGKVMGYIGYNVLKEYEVYFNFERRHISLINIDHKGNYIGKRPQHIAPIDSTRLRENTSKPYLLAEVGGKKLRFGIDTGAGRSIIRKGILKKINDQIEWQKDVLTAGFSGKVHVSKRGTLSHINISQTNWKLIEVIVTNKWQSMDSPRSELDGVLGYDFISQRTLGINLIKNQIYFLPKNTESDVLIVASSDQ